MITCERGRAADFDLDGVPVAPERGDPRPLPAETMSVRAPGRRRAGFTLVEVLVTLAILLVVLAALGSCLALAHRASQAVDANAEHQQAVTLVSALLRYDLGAAGYVRPDLEALLRAAQMPGGAPVVVQPSVPELPVPELPVPELPVPGLPVADPVAPEPPMVRTLVTQPLLIRRHLASPSGDEIWVRYFEDRELDLPKLRDYRFSAGVDGRGDPQLYRSEAAGPRQPLVQGLTSLRVLSIAYEGGWRAIEQVVVSADGGGPGAAMPGIGRPAAAAHGLRLELGFAWGETVELVLDLPNAPTLSVQSGP